MKKNLILTIAMFSLFSCSSDDENNTDPIVGTWYLFSENNEEVSTCGQKNTMTFNENGTYSETYYYTDESDNCVSGGGDEGNWSNKGKENYGLIPSLENTEGTTKIVFSDNNNTFTIIEDNIVYKRK
ncbi:lipocalin family protein [Tenacibaculum caenipelagi]|uniref:Lipocalin-like protein n=1 Tax=Tenacibaculum caenipelagi TaxID=1325435 RepID=A0A4R6THF6_9FLAO|nr:lipocalin family protein [Tenacibaculum caenipelagi]TDQ29895.1 lipocalin-like protein [Tenacibaculum caenipelagi]